MAQPPTDHNFYHHPHSHPHPHQHPHTHTQLPTLPPQYRNPFDLLFDDRTGALNYNYIRPYIPNQLQKPPDDHTDPLVMRRPRRTRTTFTSAQIAELEQHFLQARYLTSSRLAELSAKLALGTAQVKIWFKNRRRRHKIQSDSQQKDQQHISFDQMPVSPAVSSTIKSEPTQHCNAGPPMLAPPNLQTLSLGSSGGSTPATLTPSPTPTTPNANTMEHFSDPMHPYYYTGHPPPPSSLPAIGKAATAQRARNVHLHGPHYPATMGNSPIMSFYAPAASTAAAAAALHQQQHQHLQQQHQQPHHHHLHQQQQQQQHVNIQQHSLQRHHQHQALAQPQYHQQSHHQYEYHHHKTQAGGGASIKDDADFNFNNPYYNMRMATAAGPIAAAAASTAAPQPPVVVPMATAAAAAAASKTNADTTMMAMSPGSDGYEQLSPRTDASPGLCNGSGSGNGNVGRNMNINGSGTVASNNGCSTNITDDMDAPNQTKSIQTALLSTNGNGNDNACGNARTSNGTANGNGSATICSTVNMMLMDDCTGAYAKYSRMSSDTHETSYQCTMDTLMHAYNSHRSASSSTQQFAYCFN